MLCHQASYTFLHISQHFPPYCHPQHRQPHSHHGTDRHNLHFHSILARYGKCIVYNHLYQLTRFTSSSLDLPPEENQEIAENSLNTISTSVLYADDDTDHATDKDPDTLLNKIQYEADCSTSWVNDNKLVCSGGKTKLLIVATPALRLARIGNQSFNITVCGNVVKESDCERILGIIFNNKFTWWNHLFGDNSDPNKPVPGLVSQLSKRVGMLCKLSRILPKDGFITIVNGIFMSKLMYCLQLYGTVWGLQTLQDGQRRHYSFTKSHLHILQVLQNKVLRLITGKGYLTPVNDLLEQSGMLSVNQLIAYTTLCTIFKTKHCGEPKYLEERIRARGYGRKGNEHDIIFKYNLQLSREAFMYQGSKLWNNLPSQIRTEEKLSSFKRQVKEWIKLHITTHP